MSVLVISHKECWSRAGSPTGVATVGGFPQQLRALTEVFDETTLIATRRAGPPPDGAQDLVGRELRVILLDEPGGRGWRRKLAMLGWLPWHLPVLCREARRARAVHALVPGDVGFVGLLVALLLRRPLLVRHCGTWGRPATAADHVLHILLERLAGQRMVVLATGGGDLPPSADNASIRWIFSTTLSGAELAALSAPEPWRPGVAPRLVNVGRLTAEKNVRAVLEALPRLRQRHPGLSLDVVGDGPERAALEALTRSLGISPAVRFHGNVAHEQVLRIVSGAHLFVFPTRVREGFPKAVVEALACGVPVLASGVSVIPHLLARPPCGVTLEETTAGAVSRAIEAVFDDPERLASMSANARTVARAYTLDAWTAELRRSLPERWGLAT